MNRSRLKTSSIALAAAGTALVAGGYLTAGTAYAAPISQTPTSATAMQDACGGGGGHHHNRHDHNEHDTMFAQMMIPHHRQAVEMGDMAPGRSDNQDILHLAEDIKAAQQPEIDLMTKLLRQWHEPLVGDTDHEGHGDHGMMTDEEMHMLEMSTGAEFDRMFLEMMIHHHMGAIEMSKMEVDQGKSHRAKRLARDIIESQEEEVQYMQSLLAGLEGSS